MVGRMRRRRRRRRRSRRAACRSPRFRARGGWGRGEPGVGATRRRGRRRGSHGRRATRRGNFPGRWGRRTRRGSGNQGRGRPRRRRGCASRSRGGCRRRASRRRRGDARRGWRGRGGVGGRPGGVARRGGARATGFRVGRGGDAGRARRGGARARGRAVGAEQRTVLALGGLDAGLVLSAHLGRFPLAQRTVGLLGLGEKRSDIVEGLARARRAGGRSEGTCHGSELSSLYFVPTTRRSSRRTPLGRTAISGLMTGSHTKSGDPRFPGF